MKKDHSSTIFRLRFLLLLDARRFSMAASLGRRLGGGSKRSPKTVWETGCCDVILVKVGVVGVRSLDRWRLRRDC